MANEPSANNGQAKLIGLISNGARAALASSVRSGLELSGHHVVFASSIAELATVLPMISDVIFFEYPNPTDLHPPITEDQQSAQTVMRDYPPIYGIPVRTIGLPNYETNEVNSVIDTLLHRVAAAGGIKLRLVKGDSGFYSALGTKASGREGELSPLEERIALNVIKLVGDWAGFVPDQIETAEVLQSELYLLIDQGLYRSAIKIYGNPDNRKLQIELALLNSRQLNRLQSIADGRITGIGAQYFFPLPPVMGAQEDDPQLETLIKTLFFHAWRAGASEIIIQEATGVGRVNLLVEKIWLAYDDILPPYLSVFAGRMRDLIGVVFERDIESGNFTFRAAGEDVDVDVLIVPTATGTRIEAKLKKATYAAPVSGRIGTKPVTARTDSYIAGKSVLFLGDSLSDLSFAKSTSETCRSLISVHGSVDQSDLLYFVLTYYRSLAKGSDPRAAYSAAKVASVRPDQVLMFE